MLFPSDVSKMLADMENNDWGNRRALLVDTIRKVLQAIHDDDAASPRECIRLLLAKLPK